MNIKTKVFWHVTPYCLVAGYKHFASICSLHSKSSKLHGVSDQVGAAGVYSGYSSLKYRQGLRLYDDFFFRNFLQSLQANSQIILSIKYGRFIIYCLTIITLFSLSYWQLPYTNYK
jgi:hypothetical protein